MNATETKEANGTVTGPTVATAMVRAPSQSIEPSNFQELKALAAHAAKSKFYGAEDESQALMILMAGRDLGLSYVQALRAFHVVNGRPSLSADGMVAVCLGKRDVCEYFRVTGDERGATATTKRVGDVERSYTFTMEDATRAGLPGGRNGHTWKAHPKRMLSARAKAFLARDVYPDLLMGLYDPDELTEAKPARTSSPNVAEELEGEVVHEPPKPDPQTEEFARLLAALERCDSHAALDDAGKTFKEALKSKAITRTHFNALAKRGAEMRALIDAAAAQEPAPE